MKKSKFFIITLVIIALTSCKEAPIRVACVGDSITEGARHKKQSISSYPAVLDQILGHEYTVLNSGRSGTTALVKSNNTYWNCKEITNTFAFNPDIITIKLGTNDTKPGNWNSTNFSRDMQALVDTFSTIVPQPRIILCLPVPAFKDGKIRDSVIINGVIPIIKDIAATNNLQTIDLNTPLLDFPQFFKDGIHPNEEGAKMIAEIIAKELV